VRTLWADKVGTWIAIDLEQWERLHTVITEFGWSRVRWQDSGEMIEDKGHWIIQENQTYRNGTYVADRREVSKGFLFDDDGIRHSASRLASITTLARVKYSKHKSSETACAKCSVKLVR
jgi:hypothetical protein